MVRACCQGSTLNRSTVIQRCQSLAICVLALAAALLACGVVWAEPSSPKAKLIEVRPYIGGPYVYIRTNIDAVCGTSLFRIDTTKPNGREAYAAALAAITSGKTVVVEVANDTGCAGWGTLLQSIYIVAD